MARAGKTVFMVVHQGFAARSLLRTDVFRTLKAAGVRIVVLTPNHDEQYMAAEFADENVVLEPLRTDQAIAQRPRLFVLLSHLRNYTLANGHRASTLQEKYANSHARLGEGQPLVTWCIRLALKALWRSKVLRKLLLAAEMRLFTGNEHRDLFDKHRPDLVITTGPGYFLPDALLLREARRHRVESVSIVLGWDNPTSKGYRGANPGHILVWSEEMARQMVEYHDLSRDRIVVCGVPHFDHYASDRGLLSRDDLFRQLGLDRERHLVLLATASPGSYGQSALLAETLARACRDGLLGERAQLVIRLHPINFRADHRTSLDAFERIRTEYPYVQLDVPEVLSERLRCDMPGSDAVRLGSLLKHCSVLVNVFSTTTLEAFLLDRPVVLVSEHVGAPTRDGAGPSGPHLARPFHEFTHLQSVVQEGAGRIAYSLEEMVDLTRRYIESPELDRSERLRVARAECGPTDGYAGERVAHYLLGLLGYGSALGHPPEGAPSASARPSGRDRRAVSTSTG
jgi:hypothetical protein